MYHIVVAALTKTEEGRHPRNIVHHEAAHNPTSFVKAHTSSIESKSNYCFEEPPCLELKRTMSASVTSSQQRRSVAGSTTPSRRTDSDLSSMIIPENEQLEQRLTALPEDYLTSYLSSNSTSMRSLEAYNSYGHNTIRIVKGKRNSISGKRNGKITKQSKYPVSPAASKLLHDFSD